MKKAGKRLQKQRQIQKSSTAANGSDTRKQNIPIGFLHSAGNVALTIYREL